MHSASYHGGGALAAFKLIPKTAYVSYHDYTAGNPPLRAFFCVQWTRPLAWVDPSISVFLEPWTSYKAFLAKCCAMILLNPHRSHALCLASIKTSRCDQNTIYWYGPDGCMGQWGVILKIGRQGVPEASFLVIFPSDSKPQDFTR